MSHETSPIDQSVEVVAEEEQQLSPGLKNGLRAAVGWTVGSLLLGGGAVLGVKHQFTPEDPCQTTVKFSPEGATSRRSGLLADGNEVYIDVFSELANKKGDLPEVEVSVSTDKFGKTKFLAEKFDEPGPEATVQVSDNQKMLVDLTKHAVTFSCAPVNHN
jgi:hypothetical protein